MITHSKKIIIIPLLLCLIFQSACGTKKTIENNPDIQDTTPDENPATQMPDETAPTHDAQAEEGIVLHRGDWPTSAGVIEQTWTKDYDPAEWENTPCLYLYIHLPLADNTDYSVFEDELNHRLFMAGYPFHVCFLQCSNEEWFEMKPDAIIERREAELGVSVDLYLTYDYLADIERGALLDLTDYVEEQRGLYEHYDETVWAQLRSGNNRIYGIPTSPAAAEKLCYAYNPQLASLLSLDMDHAADDLSSFEPHFSAMVESGVVPLTLDLIPKDYLMLSLFGLETYGDIFAVRHHETAWEAVDFFQEPDVTGFYQKLGDWMEKGYLCYSSRMLDQLDLREPSLEALHCRYHFLQLQGIANISWFYDVNMANEGGFLETDFLIPDQPAFLYKKVNSEIMVVNAQTDHPNECMEFLRLFTLDGDIRLLLYSGIEGYNYIWEDDIQIFDPQNGAFANGLSLESDLRFWPVKHYSDLYVSQIETLNADVRISASLQHPFAPDGLAEKYDLCRQLFEENALVFFGYYGAETKKRLETLHQQLIDAGYLELIDAINDSAQ